MSRVRQARRCCARRTDGEPCKAYALVGAEVCQAHGGSAPQVRKAARRRMTEADIIRAADAAIARYERELRDWYVNRIARASVLLGMPVSDFIGPGGVNEALLSWCHYQHGEPAPLSEKPKIRTDGRFAATRAHKSATQVSAEVTMTTDRRGTPGQRSVVGGSTVLPPPERTP